MIKVLTMLTNDIVSFEQLDPEEYINGQQKQYLLYLLYLFRYISYSKQCRQRSDAGL